jgi:hypothetical protein
MLRDIVEPKREEVTGNVKKCHNEKLRDSCSSPNTIRVFKSSKAK